MWISACAQGPVLPWTKERDRSLEQRDRPPCAPSPSCWPAFTSASAPQQQPDSREQVAPSVADSRLHCCFPWAPGSLQSPWFSCLQSLCRNSYNEPPQLRGWGWGGEGVTQRLTPRRESLCLSLLIWETAWAFHVCISINFPEGLDQSLTSEDWICSPETLSEFPEVRQGKDSTNSWLGLSDQPPFSYSPHILPCSMIPRTRAQTSGEVSWTQGRFKNPCGSPLTLSKIRLKSSGYS